MSGKMKCFGLFIVGFVLIGQYLFAFGSFSSNPYLTPTASSSNSICINWNTYREESTIVAYGITPSLEDTFRFSGVRYYHHAQITNLTSNTKYYYRVLPFGSLKEFRTFPVCCDTFTFQVLGDTRSDSAAHQSVIDRMAAYPFELFLHVGDMVNDGYNEIDWRIYFNIEDTILQDHHILPTIGNHEFPYWPYDTLFLLPGAEDYYSVEYGNVHFTILNTEMDLYGSQREWLIDDLENTQNDSMIDWIFVSFHRPPYSSGSHGSQIDVRDAWCSLFEQYDVDIVLSGHDHRYERTIPINGIVYIVSGGGGGPLNQLTSSNWFTAFSQGTYHFCQFAIADKKLFMQAIKPDGTIFDTLFLDKTVKDDKDVIKNAMLLQINPNPFTISTNIKFNIEKSSQNSAIRIYNTAGQMVKSFNIELSVQNQKSVISWDGTDDSNRKLPSGVYFVKFAVNDDYTETMAILLVR